MDGLEATRTIKSDSRGKETVVIALTASAMDEDRRTVKKSGADDFLAKPCREDELLEKMRTHLHIAYNYEEPSDAVAGGDALNAERLGQLPRELIDELRTATASGNKRLLDKLIDKVREREDAAFADTLQRLADRYEYDALSQSLEEACR
jgi:CheY-like chemotaxis protein